MNYKKRLTDVPEKFSTKLSEIRTDRASASMFASVQVDLQPGCTVPLRKMASITVQDARTVLVEVHDKASIRAVEKGLQRAAMSPTVSGTSIYIHMPPLSEERREELCKTVRTLTEEFKISIRAIRREWLDSGGTAKTVEQETKAIIEKIEQLSKQKQIDIRG